ncbi:MAG: ABC transporter permease [Bacillota bacterium]|nr:ABC transporter permease [Bacillota bacterium]MDD3298943.1 ABC transporter permease [Bacillota bacterium]MDD3850935.1 ABC transporter permease [Bacillota bacterium]MDD4708060.1 ABC transporter permease [Bacillota bacterium]
MITIIYGRLLNLKRNWLPYAFMIVLPLMLMFVLGAVVGGQESGITLPVADVDGSVHSAALVEELKGLGTYNINYTDVESLKETVMENGAEAGLIIPKGFGEGIMQGNTPRFDLFITRETQVGYSLHGVLTAAVQRLAYNTAIVDGTVEALERHKSLGSGEKGKLEERVHNLVAEEWEERLPIKVAGSTVKSSGGGTSFDMYTQTSIGFTIAFSMFTMIFAVGEILEEKRTGVWDRIHVSPVSRFRVLTGGLICAFVMGMINMMVMVLISDAVLRVNWLGHIGGVIVILSAFCFCMVAFGLLLSFGIKTSQQLQVIAPVVLVSSAMLGGCYWPLEIVGSRAMLIASKVMPAGWAMLALKDMIVYNQGLEAVYLPAAVLLLMGVIFLGTALQLGERA